MAELPRAENPYNPPAESTFNLTGKPIWWEVGSKYETFAEGATAQRELDAQVMQQLVRLPSEKEVREWAKQEIGQHPEDKQGIRVVVRFWMWLKENAGKT